MLPDDHSQGSVFRTEQIRRAAVGQRITVEYRRPESSAVFGVGEYESRFG